MGRLRNRIASVIAGKPERADNSLTPAQEFLHYGNRGRMMPDWQLVDMSDRDLYTGYMYAAIRNRAYRVASVAEEFVDTDAARPILDAAKSKKEDLVHPYLQVIDDSDDFSNTDFWSRISTWSDLKGVYYLMAVRTVQGNRVGNVKEFKLLNPYNIQRVRSKDDLQVIGYKETRGSYSRNIPKEMIIEMWDFNPFDDKEPYAMAQAAKEPRFTMKQASDFTRSSLRHNVKSSGIISTDVILNKEQMENFRSRIYGQNKGEPIFTDGAGKVSWDPMTVDLDKAALDKITGMNLEELLAVTGMSRTTFGIEVSGVTRDTSKVQYEKLVASHTLPRVKWIINALNQDYKRYYKTEAKRNGYRLQLGNPFGTDKDAEVKDSELRTKNYELYKSLIDRGYDKEIAAKYASGEATLEELGEPTNPPVTPPQATPPAAPPPADPEPVGQSLAPAVRNALDPAATSTLTGQESSLLAAVVRVQERVVVAVIGKVTRNGYDSTTDIIDAEERRAAEEELTAAVAAFYAVIVPLYAATVMSRRAAEFGLLGAFELTIAIREGIGAAASRASLSHVGTILEDLLQAVRQAALSGASQAEIVTAIRQEFGDMSKVRAKVIAKTETNRAFAMSQFEADRQFLEQNGLMPRSFKKWICRGPNPCVFCRAKQSEPAIPFEQPFAEVGDVVHAEDGSEDGSITVRKYPVTYETVYSGDIHPNGNCGYQLVVE